MFSFDNKQPVTDSGPFTYGHEISLTIRRLDLTDPITGGNKWFKLRHNIQQFKKGKFTEIVTFGGAYSNHIAAVARAGKQTGIKTIGIIRGETESINNNTLSRAAHDGMQLVFISRNDYRKKTDTAFLTELLPNYNSCFIIPEGGSNAAGVRGCIDILDEKDDSFTHVVSACGTGATAAGLILGLKTHQHLIGFSILRDNHSMELSIKGQLRNFISGRLPENWQIEHGFHFGGYAKTTPELDRFITQFSNKTGILVEPVYTGKVFYGLEQLIQSGTFPPGSKILAIHTGGMQYLNPS